MTVVVPTLDKLNKEGEQGRKRINQWTRYSAVGLSVIQGYFIALFLRVSAAAAVPRKLSMPGQLCVPIRDGTPRSRPVVPSSCGSVSK